MLLKLIFPLLNDEIPDNTFSSVVFPDPFMPLSNKREPAFTFKETLFSIKLSLKDL